MTPDEIEKALEQPEFNKPLMELARAMIALEKASEAVAGLERGDSSLEDIVGDIGHEIEYEVCENLSQTFGEARDAAFDPPAIVMDYYDGIKARLLSPAYRLKQALENPS